MFPHWQTEGGGCPELHVCYKQFF